MRLNIEHVSDFFYKNDYILLSNVYINSRTKLEYRCPKGHIHCMSFDNFRCGKRCPTCRQVIKPSVDYIRKKMMEEGYNLITDIYVNNRQKLEYVCPVNHTHSISWSEWCVGHRCPYCNGNAKIKIEDIKEAMLKEGYVLLSKTYVNAHTHLEYICPAGHFGRITWSNWNNKKKFRCPSCSKRVSKQEKEIQEFLLLNNIHFIPNDRTILINTITNKPLELDLWFPEKRKAIEFNGEYWHNRSETIELDLIKQELCRKNNIDLLTVWFKDFIKHKGFILHGILKFINSNKEAIWIN